MTTDFAQWLQQALDVRKMKATDLARLAGKDQGMISRILRRERKPTPDTLNAIAHALRMPPRAVFEAAGELPPDPDKDEWVDEMAYKLSIISQEHRDVLGRIISGFAEKEEKERETKRKVGQKTKTART